MSVAYELDFAVDAPVGAPGGGVPVRRRLAAVPDQVPDAVAAPVSVLRPLDDPRPLRLTRRGIVVLGLAVGTLGAGVIALAAHSAPASPGPTSAGPSVVTVRAGDTLWSIASSAAPNTDPRAEISSIQTLNHLHGAALVPGQHIRVR